MPVEQRGLAEDIADVRGKESRLEEIPATEQWPHEEALQKQDSRGGLSDKLSLLRHIHRGAVILNRRLSLLLSKLDGHREQHSL